MPKYLPSDLTQYVLNFFSAKSPPFHVTLDDTSSPPEHLEVEQITGHQLICGRSGIIVAQYETHWVALLSSSWERELDLYYPSQPPHPTLLVRHPNTTPTRKPPLPTDVHRRRAAGVIAITRSDLPRPRIHPRPRDRDLSTFSSTLLPSGAHLWYKVRDGLCGGWATSPITPPRTPLRKYSRTPRRTTPASSGSSTTLDRSRSIPVGERHNLQSRQLRIAVFATP